MAGSNATLGYEVFDPTTNPARSNGIGFAYPSRSSREARSSFGRSMAWTAVRHLHLNNAQIIDRVGWDGVIELPRLQGLKETIRMNPLEAIFIAQKADLPTVPFQRLPGQHTTAGPAAVGDTTGFTNINPKTYYQRQRLTP